MKVRRLILSASALLCGAGLMSAPALASGASSAWSDLWRTPDQQGQALLDAGRPAQAAARFRDPRRRAYADLEVGRYEEAAKLLAPFTDAESEYNRGNALAESRQLRAALAAYDAALKQSPADTDIRHNRDLVARALQQQRQSPQSSRNGQQSRRGTGSGRQPSGAGQRDGSGSQQAGSGKTASSGSRPGANQPGDAGRQPSGGGGDPSRSGPQQASATGSGMPKDTPGQAQRDAALAASVAREQRQRNGAGNPTQAQGSDRNGAPAGSRNAAGKGADSGLLAGGTATPKQKPETERELALDQWLRQIPDSPAGLLQRKFLIEHMMKQEGRSNPEEDGQ